MPQYTIPYTIRKMSIYCRTLAVFYFVCYIYHFLSMIRTETPVQYWAYQATVFRGVRQCVLYSPTPALRTLESLLGAFSFKEVFIVQYSSALHIVTINITRSTFVKYFFPSKENPGPFWVLHSFWACVVRHCSPC